MTTPIQKLDSIGPAEDLNDAKPTKSRAQLDYDEGRGYVERGEAALAAVALHNALRGFEEENNLEGIANASNQLGHACLLREEFDKAILHYKKAWEICEELEDHLSLLSVAKQLATAHKGLGSTERRWTFALICWTVTRGTMIPRTQLTYLNGWRRSTWLQVKSCGPQMPIKQLLPYMRISSTRLWLKH